MDIIEKLQALRQEFCEIENAGTEQGQRGRAIDRAIDKIDALIEALQELENNGVLETTNE